MSCRKEVIDVAEIKYIVQSFLQGVRLHAQEIAVLYVTDVV